MIGASPGKGRCADRIRRHKMRTFIPPCAAVVACLLAPGGAGAQTPFTVGPISAMPRSVASGALAVPARPGDDGTTIPVSIVHGVRPGPVLVLTAGVHGQEYSPTPPSHAESRRSPSNREASREPTRNRSHGLSAVFPGRCDTLACGRMGHHPSLNPSGSSAARCCGAVGRAFSVRRSSAGTPSQRTLSSAG